MLLDVQPAMDEMRTHPLKQSLGNTTIPHMTN